MKKLRQTGSSIKKIDKLFIAKKPGKRVSLQGNIYYEYRRNRTDIDRKKRI